MEIQILNLIQKIRTPFGDVLMPFISSLGNYGMIWIVLMVILLALRHTRKAGLVLGAALLLDLVISNLILKPLAARPRPFTVNQTIQLLIAAPKDYSFPSGHTAAAVASISALLLAGQRKLGMAVLVLGSLIAFSRLYLYVHYPTDILGGALLGIFCGWAGYKVVLAAERRWIAYKMMEKSEI